MLKKIVASIALCASALASTQFAQAQSISNSRVVMAKEVVKNKGPNNVTNEFVFGDKINAYFTYEWDSSNPPQKLYARWYNCNRLVGAALFLPNARKNPHNVWFWIDAEELGGGESAVAIYADGKLEQTQRFTVKDADGNGSCTPQQPEIFEMSADALFAFGRSGRKDINPKGLADLQALSSQLGQMYSRIDNIRVVGHTDRIGSEASNIELSKARANTIRNMLLEMGVSGSAVQANGVGPSQPRVSCEGKMKRDQLIACLAPNRRVEIQITGERRK